MKRFHLFEFEDYPWFPQAIRKGITDFLEFQADLGKVYKPVMDVLKKGIATTKAGNIVDLCSGGGGGTLSISKQLHDAGISARITLTDKFPNGTAFAKISKASDGRIDYRLDSVDAMAVPADLAGFRTLFVSFHHFKPADAARILEDAATKREPIAIFEYTERTFLNLVMMAFAPAAVWLATPFMRSITTSKLVLTYLLPLIPLFTMIDGFVSVLRTYSVDELREMTSKLQLEDYSWEAGRAKIAGPLHVVFLLGYPTAAPASVGLKT